MQQGRAMTGQELGIGMQAQPVAIQVAGPQVMPAGRAAAGGPPPPTHHFPSPSPHHPNPVYMKQEHGNGMQMV
ncbi:hypothetical protein Pint_11563 [Pistacia integerrima]|uniref:Uncharacterized protein n=1 Tax=Pistacia integerrima TaxID=434235 RepID=A0ACC0XN81_9ROSI|nr:hypothetical protein Pint_11563 [Pistacia integerrima]